MYRSNTVMFSNFCHISGTWKTHIFNTLPVSSSTQTKNYSICLHLRANFVFFLYIMSISFKYIAECLSYASRPTFLVKGSAKLSSDRTKLICTVPSTTYSRIKWYFTLMCFVLPLFLGCVQYKWLQCCHKNWWFE